MSVEPFKTRLLASFFVYSIPSVANETAIGTELRSGAPWVRAITNTQLSATQRMLNEISPSPVTAIKD